MKYLYYADMVLVPIAIIFIMVFHILSCSVSSSFFGLVFVGVVIWSLFEYWIHRALHAFRDKGHIYHHAYPKDQSGPSLFMTIVYLVGLYEVLFLALGRHAAIPLDCGIMLGYSIYLYAHNMTHFTKLLPRNAMRIRHEKHHRGVAKHYGVITGLWDFLFS
jgi:sterol desaturase/sphingolipid hydroxylase (fatty acid hydroxylase superfamily)